MPATERHSLPNSSHPNLPHMAEIALATPALWSAVSLSTTATIHFDRQLPISKIWLTRSRNSPLSIHIIETDFRSRASEFFAPVFEHQARYEHLKLHLTRSQLPAMGEAMPLLRHLDLQFIGAPGVFALREAPLLRSVSLDVDVSCVVLPWAQLTSLRWHYIFPGEFILILRQTPNLVNCEVDILFGGGSDLPDIVTLPCLEALVLDDPWDGPSTAERLGLLSTFFIPALQRLRISERILKPNPIRSLASFINESGCQLREVHITGTSACPLSVPEDTYREAFSSIQMFSFSGPYHQEREEDLEVESGSSDGSSDGENNSA
ncbi:hypothetical protein B0H19DRAFT_1234040 [Mycena capillaripes]|nr:hypothetical protein B0H19DRAFT_1234040 [Mycena capillaripes]